MWHSCINKREWQYADQSVTVADFLWVYTCKAVSKCNVKYRKTTATLAQIRKDKWDNKKEWKSKHMADRQLKNVKPEKLFFFPHPFPCRFCFFHTWGGFFMDAGYISLRLEAVSLQTAHQDEWQQWGRELDQRRRRRPGLTIHFLPQSENLHIVASTQKVSGKKREGKEEEKKKTCSLLDGKISLWLSSCSWDCNIHFDL